MSQDWQICHAKEDSIGEYEELFDKMNQHAEVRPKDHAASFAFQKRQGCKRIPKKVGCYSQWRPPIHLFNQNSLLFVGLGWWLVGDFPQPSHQVSDTFFTNECRNECPIRCLSKGHFSATNKNERMLQPDGGGRSHVV